MTPPSASDPFGPEYDRGRREATKHIYDLYVAISEVRLSGSRQDVIERNRRRFLFDYAIGVANPARVEFAREYGWLPSAAPDPERVSPLEEALQAAS